METKLQNLILLLFNILLISSFFIPVLQVEALHPREAATVIYLYYDDFASAQDYESLLTSFGITVYLEKCSNVYGSSIFYDAQLVIIGDDTENAWGDDSYFSDVYGAIPYARFLGLGEGGYQFFGDAGWLEIGYPHGAHATETRVYVSNTSHPIFNYPISISMPGDQILTLYTSTSDVSIWMETPIPSDITLLGRDPDTSDSDYYPFIQEDHSGTYILWGFSDSPSNMTQTGKDLFINLVLWLTGWEAPTGYSAAYVYATNLTSAQSYQTLLETNGIACDLILNSSAGMWNYSSYGLIIIGSDTGSGSTWTPTGAPYNISLALKPILGLGFGGSSFFGEIGSILRWDYGWIGTENRIYVGKPDHQIFHFPNTITIPTNKTIKLYTATDHIGIYRDPLHFTDIPFGREPGDANHYPLMQEYSNWVLWGFNNSPSSMTQTGKDLFINIVIWLQGQIVPEFSLLGILLLIMPATLVINIVFKKKQDRF